MYAIVSRYIADVCIHLTVNLESWKRFVSK